MLSTNDYISALNVREDKLKGIYVEGLSEYVVHNQWEALQLMVAGERNRITRST